ncbi:MAG TPA: DUF1353 domain-containing protein, partial [Burkholderiaceae bacterium]|nr:DUF1353 domain-containing protein [Burkholderiaceae bacterium]
MIPRLVLTCVCMGLAPCGHTATDKPAPADALLQSGFTPLSVTVIGKNTFMVRDALTMTFKDGTPAIVVPAGFVTDLGSVPKRMRWWEGKSDASIAPAIVHDYLYWVQPCSQDEADAVMFTAMNALNVGPTKNPATWRLSSYQTLGNSASGVFKQNSDSRRNGEKRTLTVEYASRLLQAPFEPDDTVAAALQKAKAASGLVQQESASPAVKLTCARALEKCKACRNDAA